MWGTDMTATVTVAEGPAFVFVAVDHCTAECIGLHAAKRGTRFEALEPIRQGIRERFGGIGEGVARGLRLRHDHGSNYLADDFQQEVAFFGIESSPSFVREPEGNGVAERFIRTGALFDPAIAVSRNLSRRMCFSVERGWAMGASEVYWPRENVKLPPALAHEYADLHWRDGRPRMKQPAPPARRARRHRANGMDPRRRPPGRARPLGPANARRSCGEKSRTKSSVDFQRRERFRETAGREPQRTAAPAPPLLCRGLGRAKVRPL